MTSAVPATTPGRHPRPPRAPAPPAVSPCLPAACALRARRARCPATARTPPPSGRPTRPCGASCSSPRATSPCSADRFSSRPRPSGCTFTLVLSSPSAETSTCTPSSSCRPASTRPGTPSPSTGTCTCRPCASARTATAGRATCLGSRCWQSRQTHRSGGAHALPVKRAPNGVLIQSQSNAHAFSYVPSPSTTAGWLCKTQAAIRSQTNLSSSAQRSGSPSILVCEGSAECVPVAGNGSWTKLIRPSVATITSPVRSSAYRPDGLV